jgi:hypothetical protein
MTRKEWRSRHDPEIAEPAETLGVSTDQVEAVANAGGCVYVWYAPDIREPQMMRATLRRDQDSVLRKIEEVEYDTFYE